MAKKIIMGCGVPGTGDLKECDDCILKDNYVGCKEIRESNGLVVFTRDKMICDRVDTISDDISSIVYHECDKYIDCSDNLKDLLTGIEELISEYAIEHYIDSVISSEE